MTTFFDIETTGLNPYRDNLLTIQVKKDGDLTVWRVWEMSEATVLEGFLGFMGALPSSETIVGYNIMGFDLPFIAARLSLNHAMDESTHARLYRSRKWFDLYHYLGADFKSVDYWLGRVGVARNCLITGKDVPILYIRGEYEKIERHAIEDLALCELLYQRLGSVRVSSG
ncbi:MAG: ribonuclease H-like domain-containing protein [Nitrososphaerales archaeon]|jgi:uncharacterized protein YprB with RNaseH-like and TPR domain